MRRARDFRRVLIGASLLLMQAAAPGPLAAHEPADAVRVVLDGVEPPVAGLRVQVFDDHLAPQLVLENLSGAVLEILDEDGRAFLRIKTGAGVEADVAASAWYRTLSPGGAPVPVQARAADKADWRRVRAQPSWGWFDPRLGKERVAAPAAAAEAVALGQWRVPARLGTHAIEIRGHFLYQPRPGGLYRARLTAGPELAPSVRVTLSPGRPPALLLENSGAVPVSVLGKHDEPFLRVSADGVEANLASPTWQDLGRYRGLTAPDAVGGAGGARWHRISLAPRYSWLEPRAGMPSVVAAGARPDNAPSKVKGWQVPILVGERRMAIQGVVEWVPLPALAAGAGN
jgi:hypothetical protein